MFVYPTKCWQFVKKWKGSGTDTVMLHGLSIRCTGKSWTHVFWTGSECCSDIAGTLINRSDFLLATVSHVVKELEDQTCLISHCVMAWSEQKSEMSHLLFLRQCVMARCWMVINCIRYKSVLQVPSSWWHQHQYVCQGCVSLHSFCRSLGRLSYSSDCLSFSLWIGQQ